MLMSLVHAQAPPATSRMEWNTPFGLFSAKVKEIWHPGVQQYVSRTGLIMLIMEVLAAPEYGNSTM